MKDNRIKKNCEFCQKEFLARNCLKKLKKGRSNMAKLVPYKNTMPKSKPSGKLVKGKKYTAADEEYDKKMIKKDSKGMKTAGIAKELKMSEKEMGYSKKPRVKPQKKGK